MVFNRKPPGDYFPHIRSLTKNVFIYYTKDIKMMLIEAMLKTLVPIFNMFLFVVLTLKVTMQNYLSESWRESSEISVLKFRFRETTVFGIHSNITYVSEICYIIIAVMTV